MKSIEYFYERDGGRCFYCQFHVERKEATRDHKIPKSKNGSDDEGNIVLACRRCNTEKADSLLDAIAGVIRTLRKTPKKINNFIRGECTCNNQPHSPYCDRYW